jgi:hypothetical protein
MQDENNPQPLSNPSPNIESPVAPIPAPAQQPQPQVFVGGQASASTPITPMPEPTPSVEPKKKANPPIAAQILYALGLLGLIFGLLASILMIFGPTDLAGNIASAIGSYGSTNPKVEAAIFAVIVIILFVLVNALRARKRWGLIAYSAVVVLGFIGSLYEWFTRSAVDKLLNGNNPAGNFLPYIIILPLLLVLWTRNRKDFN